MAGKMNFGLGGMAFMDMLLFWLRDKRERDRKRDREREKYPGIEFAESPLFLSLKRSCAFWSE